MSSEYAIEVNGLGKCYQIYNKPSDRLKQMLMRGRKQYYKEFWALKDVSFKIRKGETVGIIGRNGSGKSTLLQMICGTLNPTAGEVKVNGRVAALLELGSGFNPEFTGRENVHMNASILGLEASEISARFEDIVAFADIGEFIEQPVKTYSSGMVVRLAFAVIAHVNADILVIDEALAVGDAFFTQKCMRFLREFMKTGTVLFVSHDTAAVKNLCSESIWLNHGKIEAQGTSKDVTDIYLEDYYAQINEQITDSKSAPAVNIPAKKLAAIDFKDQRLDFINNTNLRNDIKIFEFDFDAPSFGSGGARIYSVILEDSQGQPLNWVVGGEMVSLCIEAIALEYIQSPIVGFIIKDRLGQGLFGDNTYLSYWNKHTPCQTGQRLCAKFNFAMPRLNSGDYSVTVAVADGTQEQHTQLQWTFDALHFRSESISASSGLIGIPMNNIQLTVE